MNEPNHETTWGRALEPMINIKGETKRIGECTTGDLQWCIMQRQRYQATGGAPPSEARIKRARSMAKMTGHRLSKRGDQWVIVADTGEPRPRQGAKAAFEHGFGQPFDTAEEALFRLLEAAREIPHW
jgi:hypothetical protein